MKTIIIFLVLLLGTEIVFGQKTSLDPMVSYGRHTTQDIKNLVWENSAKGTAFKTAILEKFQECLKDTLVVTEENIDYLLQDKFMFCEELTLEAGTWQNSGWNGKQIVFSNEKQLKLTDFFWIFRMGSHEVVLCKGNCLNIVNIFEQTVVYTTPAHVQQVQHPAVHYGQNVYVVRNGVVNSNNGYNYGNNYHYSNSRQNVYVVRNGVTNHQSHGYRR